MLNTVSQRIRKIIKSQDQTPQSQIYKQRQHSIDSNRSATNSKSNLPSMPPKSPSKIHTQSNKIDKQKTNQNIQSHSNSHIHSQYNTKNSKYEHNGKNIKYQQNEREQEESRLIGSGVGKGYGDYQQGNRYFQGCDQEEIINKIRDKVMESLYPILAEFQKKIEASIGVWKGVQAIINDLQDQKNESNNNSIIFNNLDQLSERISKVEQKIVYSLQAELTKLSHQYISISQKLSSSVTQPSSPTSRLNKNFQSSSSFFGPKAYQNQFIQYQLQNQKIQKCKCEKLVQEILKSQDHLMMELKYVKHFMGMNANNANKKG